MDRGAEFWFKQGSCEPMLQDHDNPMSSAPDLTSNIFGTNEPTVGYHCGLKRYAPEGARHPCGGSVHLNNSGELSLV